jgi:hypothetical protein
VGLSFASPLGAQPCGNASRHGIASAMWIERMRMLPNTLASITDSVATAQSSSFGYDANDRLSLVTKSCQRSAYSGHFGVGVIRPPDDR